MQRAITFTAQLWNEAPSKSKEWCQCCIECEQQLAQIIRAHYISKDDPQGTIQVLETLLSTMPAQGKMREIHRFVAFELCHRKVKLAKEKLNSKSKEELVRHKDLMDECSEL